MGKDSSSESQGQSSVVEGHSVSANSSYTSAVENLNLNSTARSEGENTGGATPKGSVDQSATSLEVNKSSEQSAGTSGAYQYNEEGQGDMSRTLPTATGEKLVVEEEEMVGIMG